MNTELGIALFIIIISNLINTILTSMLRKEKKEKNDSVYVCPLDKSGVTSKLETLSGAIDKQETKLNDLGSLGKYNQKMIEHIDEHYDRMMESFNKLINLTKENLTELKKISANGHK